MNSKKYRKNVNKPIDNLVISEEKNPMEEFKIWNIVKKNWLFFLFSFVNAFIPILICIIAATIPNTGTETMIAISFSSPFQLVFLTIPFILTFWFICFVAKVSEKYNEKQTFKDMFWIVLIFNLVIGLSMSLLFFVSAYLYVHFFYAGTNVEEIAKMGELFVGIFTPIILISSINYIFLFFLFFKFGSNRVAILEVIHLLLIIIFCFIFIQFTDLGIIGIGIGVLIGSLLSLMINFMICFIVFKMWEYKYSFNLSWIKYAIKNSWKMILIKLFASLLKPLIFFVMGGNKTVQDPNFMIAKSIWYFILYFITFFSDGISKIFLYHKIFNGNKYKLTTDSYRNINFLFLVNFLILIFLSIGSYFIVEPLGLFLIQNKGSIPDNISIDSITYSLLLPNAIAILFTLFYCVFNSVNQVITDIRPMFEAEKKINIILTLITVIIVIGVILGVGLLIMRKPIIGGLSAFTIPMSAIAFVFFLLGILGWIKLWKKTKTIKAIL